MKTDKTEQRRKSTEKIKKIKLKNVKAKEENS